MLVLSSPFCRRLVVTAITHPATFGAGSAAAAAAAATAAAQVAAQPACCGDAVASILAAVRCIVPIGGCTNAAAALTHRGCRLSILCWRLMQLLSLLWTRLCCWCWRRFLLPLLRLHRDLLPHKCSSFDSLHPRFVCTKVN